MKQLILITAPFNCGHCAKAIKELPSMAEKEEKKSDTPKKNITDDKSKEDNKLNKVSLN